MSDPAFRRDLLDDPHAAVHDELGVAVPSEVTITVLEETPSRLYLVLPATLGSSDSDELSDAELGSVAGGRSSTTCMPRAPARARVRGPSTASAAEPTRRPEHRPKEHRLTQESSDRRHEVEDRLTSRAASDPAFRRRLIDDPHPTVQDELGIALPAGVTMTVMEETADHLYLVLPRTPGDASGDLTDAQLAGVAGGGSDYLTWTLEPTGC